MKTAIVHFSGLATDPEGDCCGMRPFWEGLAETLGATFIVISWDDPKYQEKFVAVLAAHDAVYVSGHSHGGDAEYEVLMRTGTTNVLVAVFLDIAPPWKPNAWLGPNWKKVSIAGKSICFYQRNDAPLAGVVVDADEMYDVTSWGLHHSTMCADDRVHTRIKHLVLTQHATALLRFYDKTK